MHSTAIAVGVMFAVITLSATIPANIAEEQNTKTESKTQPKIINAQNDSKQIDNEKPEPNEDEVEAADEPVVVTVKPGETLAHIAERNDTTYQRIFNANESIAQPDIIAAGDKLLIPADDEELPNRIAQYRAERAAEEAERRKKAEQRQRQERQAQETSQQRAQNRPQQQTSTPQQSGTNTSTWDRLAECESNGNWSINTGNGYYGGLQFNLSSWQAVGGSGYPHQASKSEQIARAEKLRAIQGWGAWPACSAKLGLL